MIDFEMDRRSALFVAGGAAFLPLVQDRAGATSAHDRAGRFGLGRDQDFNDAWRFFRGAAVGLETPAADDSAWRTVRLPHDWSIEDVPGGEPPKQIGPFDKNAIGGTATGFTVGGEGWYRRRFSLIPLPAGARVEIVFDGVSVVSEVWINGFPLGEHVHGYTPFSFDLTPHLIPGGENVLAVRVRNMGRNSRWYAGSGIYREVRLDVVPGPARIARWGTSAWTRRIADGTAEIDVTTGVEAADPTMTLVTRLRSGDGRVAAEARCPAGADIRQSLSLRDARLWSPASPELYTLESELRRGGTVIDRVAEPIGVRIITIDAEHGIRINGDAVRLRGGCIHHDNGLLGAVALPDADERRIRLLKARGFNAIRSSHNPASRSLRTACDRLGMLMIEECFDTWHIAKLKEDYSSHIREDWQAALTAMVLSARNSPSVVMWSIGNEIPDRSTPAGLEWSWRLANMVRTLDPTRPVTAGLNGVLGGPVRPAAETARAGKGGEIDEASTVFLDVAGYNYRFDEIEPDHAQFPDRVIYASETFPKDVFAYADMASRLPYMLGEFVWTAMDYIGEAGVGATARIREKDSFYFPQWPWVNAWCGDIDLIGGQKPQSLARDVAWGLSPVEMLVRRPIPEGQKEFVAPWGWPDEVPHWTWPGSVGRMMAVRIYTAGDKVELYLDGVLAGAKAVAAADSMRVELNVAYAPGTLEVRAYRHGTEIGRRRLETTDTPAALRLAIEAQGRARKDRLSYVCVEVLDASGRIVPEAAEMVSIRIAGSATLVGFGSAEPFAVGSLQAADARTFRGRGLLILRSASKPGRVRIEARSGSLKPAVTTLTV